MKHLFGFFLVFTLFLPQFAQAATFEAGDMVTISGEETVVDNHYLAANVIELSTNIAGDVFAAGSSIYIDESVDGDVFLAAQTVTISAPISGDVRVVADQVRIAESVGGEVLAFANVVDIAEEAVIEDELRVFASTVYMAGTLREDLHGEMGQLELVGTVEGDVDVVTETLAITGPAVLNDVTYYSPEEALIADEVVVAGDLSYVFRDFTQGEMSFEWDFGGFLAQLALHWLVFKLVSLLVIGVVVFALWPRPSTLLVEDAFSAFGNRFVIGLVAAIVVPIALFIALFTYVGTSLAILAGIAYILILTFAHLVGAYVLGAWLVSLFKKKPKTKSKSKKPAKRELNWLGVLIGLVVYVAIGWIPLIGWLAVWILALVGLGSILYVLHRHIGTK